MEAQIELRRNERVQHESIIMLEDGDFGFLFYAVMYNVSRSGMYFKSLFELQAGNDINIKFDDPPPIYIRNTCRARVVWCRELDDRNIFRYEFGLEFL